MSIFCLNSTPKPTTTCSSWTTHHQPPNTTYQGIRLKVLQFLLDCPIGLYPGKYYSLSWTVRSDCILDCPIGLYPGLSDLKVLQFLLDLLRHAPIGLYPH
jgi:hypothetical protein